MSSITSTHPYDLRKVVAQNRLVGLWQMMRGFQIHYLAATCCVGISASARACTYLLLKFFIDTYFSNTGSQIPTLWIALGFVGLALIEGGFSFLGGRLSAYTAEGVTRRLRNFLLDHIQRLPFSYHDRIDTGELIERSTSDVDAIRRFFADQAIQAGRIVLLFAINLAVLLSINVKLALVSIVIVPLIVIVSIFFFKKITKIYEAYQEQEAILSTTLQENLSGVRVVKAFARQEYEIEKFERENFKKLQRGKKLTSMHSLFWPISDTVCNIQVVAGYLFAAWMAIQAEISVGDFLAYTGILAWIIFPMRNLGRLIVQMSMGLVSFDRVMTIIHESQELLDEGVNAEEGNINGALIFDQVSFHFTERKDGNEMSPPEKQILEDISFKVTPGQVVALLGSTGSGKTTLMNLLPRFYDYTGGSILLDGKELQSYSRHSLRRLIGIVEQEPFLFSRSIRENITYGCNRNISESEIITAAQRAAIHDVISGFKDGYNTIVGEKGVTLSGGQKQRVAIARTLLKDPRILILDDSTSSVDAETETLIHQALQTLMRNRTTFIIAHRIQTIMNADLILVLDQGKIVQRGCHETLLKEDGIYRKIYDIQTRIEDELEKEIASV